MTIQLIEHEKWLTIMVEDNGRGFDVDTTMKTDKGIGLKNMQSRIDYIHGTIHFDSSIGRGTTITIEIPLA